MDLAPREPGIMMYSLEADDPAATLVKAATGML
jgi:hypothetical protein